MNRPVVRLSTPGAIAAGGALVLLHLAAGEFLRLGFLEPPRFRGARYLYVSLVFVVCFLVVVRALAAVKRVPWTGLLRFDPCPPYYALVAVTAAVFLHLGIGLCREVAANLAGPTSRFYASLMERGADTSWSVFLLSWAVAPITEELFFRGIILRGLLAKPGSNAVWPVLLSALLFSIYHLNPCLMIPAFVLGLACGALFVSSRSVTACVILHLAYNIACRTW
jgi:membrane protease YdiL (CAAX protease family)